MIAWDRISTHTMVEGRALRHRAVMDIVKRHAMILKEWPIVRYYHPERHWGRSSDGSIYWGNMREEANETVQR